MAMAKAAPPTAERDLFDTAPEAGGPADAGPDLADPVRVGTASWTDKTLIDCGRFYPPGCSSAEARLRFYASRFPLVEVDSSYYAMPVPATTALWAGRTPDGFRMNVKAFRLFTDHPAAPKVLPPDVREALPKALAAQAKISLGELPGSLLDLLWQRFREALVPLLDAGRLGLVHFQFAPWVTEGDAGRALAAEAAERLAPVPISVEWRHRSWFADAGTARSTLDLLRALGAAHTVVDGPQGFSNSVPAVWETTSRDFALVRLHGRNAKTWNIKGATSASDRFNYDYPDGELASLAPRIVALSAGALETHVVFNNNMEDQGQRNARTLTELLRAARARGLPLGGMTDKQTAARADEGNTKKDPDAWVTGDEPMTGAQKSYLKTLSEEAKVDFDETLSKAGASKRIEELQAMTGRGLDDDHPKDG